MKSDRREIQPSAKTGTVTREAAREAVAAVKASHAKNGAGKGSAKSAGATRK